MGLKSWESYGGYGTIMRSSFFQIQQLNHPYIFVIIFICTFQIDDMPSQMLPIQESMSVIVFSPRIPTNSKESDSAESVGEPSNAHAREEWTTFCLRRLAMRMQGVRRNSNTIVAHISCDHLPNFVFVEKKMWNWLSFQQQTFFRSRHRFVNHPGGLFSEVGLALPTACKGDGVDSHARGRGQC